ncbi:hypothetical protein [Acaryochloris sp. IP29b_bin.137]|uniref:hypothetical protein n=1 Tax=Acaryochloris sp. IP29b_bin.137 TaxID=2969217 RepID=UPI0026037BDD|nr:hypothetical protein [Acaryochloris sp. IP29b_bin.137]
MQQLLTNRFRGLWLGVAVLEADLQQRNQPSSIDQTSTSGCSWSVPPEGLGWWDEMATSAQTLMQPAPSPSSARQPLDDDFALARLIARALPITLFFHEDLTQLEAQLSYCIPGVANPRLRDGVIGIGVAIALLCQEQAHPHTLISQLLNQPFWLTRTLPNQLYRVQDLLQDHASLATAEKDLGRQCSTPTESLEMSIALALFCWASTPDSFALTLTRGRSLTSSPIPSTLIACALSGVFNGSERIPIDLQSPLLSSSSPVSRQDILGLADQFLSVWSGCCSSITLPLGQTVVAAPGILRPRG